MAKSKAQTSGPNAPPTKRSRIENVEPDLAWLVQPHDKDTFFSQVWQQKPLVIKANERNDGGAAKRWMVDGLFNVASLEKVVGERELKYGVHLNICRVEDGEKVYMNEEAGDGVDVKQLMHKYAQDKGTVQFFQPQRYNDKLWQLLASLEQEFACLCGSNVYLTPPGAQGLAPHHDDVEIFIVQTEGKKRWRLYDTFEANQELATEYSRDFTEDEIGDPILDVVLEEGDVLYFPRGMIHQAHTFEGVCSTHITISTYQNHTWGKFLSKALPKVVEAASESDVNFRMGLPLQFFNAYGNSNLAFQNLVDGKLEDIHVSDKVVDDQAKRKRASLDAKNGELRKKMANMLRQLADFVETSHDDEEQEQLVLQSVNDAVDEASMDFVENRLPPFGYTDKDTKGETLANNLKLIQSLTMDSEIREKHPGATKTVVTKSPEGEDVLVVKSNLNNDRTTHMGSNISNSKDVSDQDASGPQVSEEVSDDEEGQDVEYKCEEDMILPIEVEAAIAVLTNSYPQFVTLNDLPFEEEMEDDDKLEFCKALLGADLIEIK